MAKMGYPSVHEQEHLAKQMVEAMCNILNNGRADEDKFVPENFSDDNDNLGYFKILTVTMTWIGFVVVAQASDGDNGGPSRLVGFFNGTEDSMDKAELKFLVHEFDGQYDITNTED